MGKERMLITGGHALEGQVRVSGGKNTAVAVIPATLLCDEPCTIENLPDIEDVHALADILQELGAKVDMYTYNQLDNVEASVDFGGRYRMGAARYIELDGYFGLNRNNGGALVLTYGREHYIAKNFSNSYEARAGFLEGVTGEDGYVKFGLGTIPTLHFGRSFLCMIEITSSGSIGHLKDDFMVDIIPKMEIAFGATRVRVEFDIGVMQDDNNDQKSIALYVMTAL